MHLTPNALLRVARAWGVELSLTFLCGLGFPIGSTAASAQPWDQHAEIAFDIPAQALASALERYSVAARREAIYNGQLAIGRRSTAVLGVFTPEVALERLLRGTGLSPRYTASDAFVLSREAWEPEKTASVNPASLATIMRYYGEIQTSLRRAFCSNSRTQPGDYRIAVSFWIGVSGNVTRTELLGSTGDADLDATIDNVISTLFIGVAPPHGFAQPVTLVIAPQPSDVTGDCRLPPAQTRSVGVAR